MAFLLDVERAGVTSPLIYFYLTPSPAEPLPDPDLSLDLTTEQNVDKAVQFLKKEVLRTQVPPPPPPPPPGTGLCCCWGGEPRDSLAVYTDISIYSQIMPIENQKATIDCVHQRLESFSRHWK